MGGGAKARHSKTVSYRYTCVSRACLHGVCVVPALVLNQHHAEHSAVVAVVMQQDALRHLQRDLIMVAREPLVHRGE